MGEKILTVSIAAYQVGSYIRQTLDSLLEEEIIDKLEIFVIDDGGKDDTLEIARSYEKAYPGTVFAVHKENGGYGSTLNYGIANASGRYFKQLDGDDWFERKNLKGFVEFLSRTEADLVLTPYRMVYTDGKTEDVDRHRLVENRLDRFPEGELRSIRLHELAVRTRLLKENKVRLSENRFYTDNEYVFFPLLYAETIEAYPDTIYCYRMGELGQSVSIEGRIRHWTDAEDIILRLAAAYEENEDALPAAVRRSLTEQLCEILLFQMGNYIIYPDSRNAFERCRDFRKKLAAFTQLRKEASGRYTLVRGLLKVRYPGFCIMRKLYAGRIH